MALDKRALRWFIGCTGLACVLIFASWYALVRRPQLAICEEAVNGLSNFTLTDVRDKDVVKRVATAVAHTWPMRLADGQWFPMPKDDIDSITVMEKEARIGLIGISRRGQWVVLISSIPNKNSFSDSELATAVSVGLPVDNASFLRRGIDLVGEPVSCKTLSAGEIERYWGYAQFPQIFLTALAASLYQLPSSSGFLVQETEHKAGRTHWRAALLPSARDSDILNVTWDVYRNTEEVWEDGPLTMVADINALASPPAWGNDLADAIDKHDIQALRQLAERNNWKLIEKDSTRLIKSMKADLSDRGVK